MVRERKVTLDFNPRPLAGATSAMAKTIAISTISIHAPLRGRLLHRADANPVSGISIHAPLRGRLCWCCVTWTCSGFQSTPPCGGDLSRRRCARIAAIFQSTPPCGGYYAAGLYRPPYRDFNPRPLAGATLSTFIVAFHGFISIHAPLRGRRQAKINAIPGLSISIHAPLRGRLSDWTA